VNSPKTAGYIAGIWITVGYCRLKDKMPNYSSGGWNGTE